MTMDWKKIMSFDEFSEMWEYVILQTCWCHPEIPFSFYNGDNQIFKTIHLWKDEPLITVYKWGEPWAELRECEWCGVTRWRFNTVSKRETVQETEL